MQCLSIVPVLYCWNWEYLVLYLSYARSNRGLTNLSRSWKTLINQVITDVDKSKCTHLGRFWSFKLSISVLNLITIFLPVKGTMKYGKTVHDKSISWLWSFDKSWSLNTSETFSSKIISICSKSLPLNGFQSDATTFPAISMLVTDVRDEMFWWQF